MLIISPGLFWLKILYIFNCLTNNNNYYKIISLKGVIYLKLVINYDLLSKIQQAKKGFVLNKAVKRIGEASLISLTIQNSIFILFSLSKEQLLHFSLLQIFYQIALGIFGEFLLVKITKEYSIETLKRLSESLKKLDINTNYELLLNSYKYKMEYEFRKSSFKKLNQKKYIIVPIYINGEEKEISLVQEHIIGSKEYYLSVGEPDKILKLSYNPS